MHIYAGSESYQDKQNGKNESRQGKSCNKGAIKAKIEANIRRKVKTYLAKQKRGLSWSRYNNSTRRKTKSQ